MRHRLPGLLRHLRVRHLGDAHGQADREGGLQGLVGRLLGTSTCVLSMRGNHAATATFVAQCIVPKVVGLSLKKAKAKIRKAHCRVGKMTKKFSTRKKKAKVLGQKPKRGKTLKPGAKVNLTIGKGPKKK